MNSIILFGNSMPIMLNIIVQYLLVNIEYIITHTDMLSQPPAPIAPHKISIPSRLNKAFLGPRSLFHIYSLNFLIDNKQNYQPHIPDIQKSQKQFRIASLACLALSGALAMSMRRYFPTIYSNSSLNKIAFDMFILGAGFLFGLSYGANSVADRINKISSDVVRHKDGQFLKFMNDFDHKFAISELQQINYISQSEKDREELIKNINEYYHKIQNTGIRIHYQKLLRPELAINVKANTSAKQ